MLEFLENELKYTLPEMQKNQLIEICNVILQFGLNNFLYELEQICLIKDSFEKEDFNNKIRETIFDNAYTLFEQFNIEFENGLQAFQIIDLLNCLKILDNYDDKETIYNILEMEEDNEYKISSIFKLLGQYEINDYLLIINSVSDELLVKIKNYYKQDIEEEVISESLVSKIKQRLIKFISIFSNTLVEDALDEGMRIGVEFSSLINPYIDLIDDLEPKRAGIEMVGFALCSNLNDNEIKEILSEKVNLIFHDINKSSIVMNSINSFLKEFSYA